LISPLLNKIIWLSTYTIAFKGLYSIPNTSGTSPDYQHHSGYTLLETTLLLYHLNRVFTV